MKIEEVLKESGGNKGRAAELLQIGFKSLLVKLREHESSNRPPIA